MSCRVVLCCTIIAFVTPGLSAGMTVWSTAPVSWSGRRRLAGRKESDSESESDTESESELQRRMCCPRLCQCIAVCILLSLVGAHFKE